MYEYSAVDLDNLGIRQYHAGALKESVQWLALAIEQAVKESDRDLEFMARGHLSEAYAKLGDFKNAIDTATVLLTKARRAEDAKHSMRAMSLLAIGIERQNLRGRWEQFQKLVNEALAIARALPSDGYWEVQNLESLGLGYLRMRQLDGALHWLQTALNAVRPETFEAGFFRARIYQYLADLMRLRGNCFQAKSYVTASHEAASERGEWAPHLLSGPRLALARILRSEGDLLEALDHVEQILGDSVRGQWRYEKQLCEKLRSDIQLDLRRGPEALHAAEQALGLAEAMGMVEEQVECLLNVARARQLLGDDEPAYANFRDAWCRARTHGFSDHLLAAASGARNLGRRIDEDGFEH